MQSGFESQSKTLHLPLFNFIWLVLPLVPARRDFFVCFHFSIVHINCSSQLRVLGNVVVMRSSAFSSRSLITLMFRIRSRPKALWQRPKEFLPGWHQSRLFKFHCSSDLLQSTAFYLVHKDSARVFIRTFLNSRDQHSSKINWGLAGLGIFLVKHCFLISHFHLEVSHQPATWWFSSEYCHVPDWAKYWISPKSIFPPFLNFNAILVNLVSSG